MRRPYAARNTWIYAAAIYQVVGLKNDGSRDYQGFAVAIPDVADLEAFCDDFEVLLAARPSERAGRFPRAAMVDVSGEAALDSAWRLRDALSQRAAGGTLEELVWGIEVVHAAKEGNNIRLHQVFRLTPDAEAERLVQDLRGRVHHPLIRRLRLENLLAKRRWYHGFDRLFETRPLKITLEDPYFRIAARELLDLEIREGSLQERTDMIETGKTMEPYSAERSVLRLVRAYVQRKVESKFGLKWKDVQEDESKKSSYQAAKHKIAKEAFLAVRSRSELDFVEYFASTLCSVPQFLPEEEFVRLSAELYSDPAKIRTFTLMALSAQG